MTEYWKPAMLAGVELDNGMFCPVEAEPECGRDFCDSCGDCLACYGGDPCFGSSLEGDHAWFVYKDRDRHTELLSLAKEARKSEEASEG